jgi:hypothetical protein
VAAESSAGFSMNGKASRRAVAVALFGAAMLASALPADAAERICRQLQAELADASGGRGQPRLVAKYDAAIDRQQGEIDKARSQARRAGCFFSLFGSNVSQCAMLNAAIDRMGGNLDKLQKRRAKLTGGGSSRDRRRILAKLEANGCNEPPQAKPQTTASAVGDHGSAGIFQPLLDPDQPDGADELAARGDSDGAQRVRRTLDQQPGAPIQIPEPSKVAGEFRTMCVRTCDGYFFPMSNAATLGDFERDQKNCESSCPGADMQVFYSRGLEGDSADMTSASTGEPYSKLPTAYLYKRTDMSVPQCGCRAAGDFSVLAGSATPDRPASGASSVSSSIVAFPAAEPAKSPPAVSSGADEPAPPEIPLDEEKRKVRVVGPRFLPDPAEAIDLRAPAPTKVP